MAPPAVIPRSRGHLVISGCGCLTSAAMLALIPLALLEGTDDPLSMWLCMSSVAAGIGLLSAWIGSQALTRAEVYGSRLELHSLRKRTIPFETITGIEHDDFLRIQTTTGTIRVGLATRNAQASLRRLLEERADGARAARTARQSQALPLSIGRRRSVILTNLALGLTFGPGMALLGVVTIVHAVLRWGHQPLSDFAVQLGMGMAWLLVGGLLGWILLSGFIRRYTFTDTHIVIHHLLWSRTYPTSQLTAVDLRSEIRTFKRMERTAWFLALTFTGGETVNVELSENGYPMEFSAVDDQLALAELRDRLRRSYRLTGA